MGTCHSSETVRFTYVDLYHYDGEGDSGIFWRSDLLKTLSEGLCGIPSPTTVGSAGVIAYVIVGDEAFPLKTSLMHPYARRGSVKYPVADDGGHPEPRTNRILRSDMKSSLISGEPSRGVKGFSPLARLPDFDLAWGVCPDYMHHFSGPCWPVSHGPGNTTEASQK
ncbi:hypothetical protein V5799_008280 [Amblyomma americanum]|uniref:DDE Tnp4 domain-containing protein n=1 Tax=Amblyomma americanum TaxID=6943 RepID=A0AAQ4FF73_AMBAM